MRVRRTESALSISFRALLPLPASSLGQLVLQVLVYVFLPLNALKSIVVHRRLVLSKYRT